MSYNKLLVDFYIFFFIKYSEKTRFLKPVFSCFLHKSIFFIMFENVLNDYL